MANASKHGNIAQSIPAGFRFAQFLHEIEEVFGIIGFKRDNEFLVVDSEAVSRV